MTSIEIRLPEGTMLKVDQYYFNKSLLSQELLAKIYYKINCNGHEGYLPSMRNILNLIDEVEFEKLPTNWVEFKKLSIFSEIYSGSFRNKDKKINLKLFTKNFDE